MKDKDKSRNIVKYVNESTKIIDLGDFESLTTIVAKPDQSEVTGEMEILFNKLKNGQATDRDLFKLSDIQGEKNGKISIEEFSILTKRLGTPLTQHRVHEIFASVKGPKVKPNDMELNEEEFSEALVTIKERFLLSAMVQMGITPEILYFSFAYLLFLLLVMFAFIFLGIKAFTVGGTFSAVINSGMPAVGALSLKKKDKKEDDKSKFEEEIKKICKEILNVGHEVEHKL